MSSQNINLIQTLFQSRLTTFEHILKSAQTYCRSSETGGVDGELLLQERIIDDMLPLGTQIAFTCNQPRNFALWCDHKPTDNLDPQVTSFAQAYEHITQTQKLLLNINADDEKLAEMTRIDLNQSLYLELPGSAYVHDFLMPNFYFHLVTAYDILRMAGVPLGKQDYMMHLGSFIKTV